MNPPPAPRPRGDGKYQQGVLRMVLKPEHTMSVSTPMAASADFPAFLHSSFNNNINDLSATPHQRRHYQQLLHPQRLHHQQLHSQRHHHQQQLHPQQYAAQFQPLSQHARQSTVPQQQYGGRVSLPGAGRMGSDPLNMAVMANDRLTSMSDGRRLTSMPNSRLTSSMSNGRLTPMPNGGSDPIFDTYLNYPDDGYSFGEAFGGMSHLTDTSQPHLGNFRAADLYSKDLGGGSYGGYLDDSGFVGHDADAMARGGNTAMTMPRGGNNALAMARGANNAMAMPRGGYNALPMMPREANNAFPMRRGANNTLSMPSIEHNEESPNYINSFSGSSGTLSNPTASRSSFGSSGGSSSSNGYNNNEIESLGLARPNDLATQDAYKPSTPGLGQGSSHLDNGAFVEPRSLSTVWNGDQYGQHDTYTLNSNPPTQGAPAAPVQQRAEEYVSYPFVPYPPDPDFVRDHVLSDMDTTPEGTASEGAEDHQGLDADSEDINGGSHIIYNSRGITATRRGCDEFLLQMRNNGHSYKEIKRFGNFREAESTLRGRVRMLTKSRAQRVRKPKWTSKDVDILRAAIDHYRKTDGAIPVSYGRISWKKISEFMQENGSSYVFAPGTCAKKWREITAQA